MQGDTTLMRHFFASSLGSVSWNGYSEKNGSKRSFLPETGAQTFWTESGRVSNAYSADNDKYKDQNEQHKSAE